MKFGKGFKQFILKTGIFITLFIAFSFLIGKNLYSEKLLNDFGIYFYGRVGYILLFSIAGFILLYREKLLELNDYKFRFGDFSFIILSFIFFILFYLIEINISDLPSGLWFIFLVHLVGVGIFLFLGLGIYGIEFVKNFSKNFKKEIFYFLIFGVVMASLMNFVWSLWSYSSEAVLKIISFVLSVFKINFNIIEPRTLFVNGFGARIEEACSGIYSIFLFSALYLFIILLDWKKINKKKAILLFVPAIAGAFFVNVLRVLILFILGGFISKNLALGLYHSYTGMIFFLIYFSIFWILFYKWMKDEQGFWNKFVKDSLYKNSIFLMLGTFIMAATGFFFWMICARLFNAENVGLATTIISAMGLITSFSLLGLNSGLIKFLGKSERKNDKINTCFTIVAIVTIIVSSIFLLLINDFSPRLFFIKHNLVLSLIFILFMIFASWSSLIEGIFIAYRSSKYNLIKNSIFGFSRLVFPFLFVSLGAYGIFSSWVVALIIGFLVSVFILIYRFNYKIKIVFYDSIIKKIGRYSFENYVAGFISVLPALILPLIILLILKPEFSAYYYIAMMIANLLFAIPTATSNSLFAEGSNNEKDMREHLKKAVKIISLLLIPSIIIIFFFGKYILLFFGEDYSSEGFGFLRLLSVSGIFIAVNSVFSSVFRIKNKVKSIIINNIVGAFFMIGLSYLFLTIGFGLVGIGYAWVIGSFVVSIFYFFESLSYLKQSSTI
ncbi:MAG: archaeosortase/exosortase family protein [Flavobacterium sp.]|uniref:archaeosortase/exosortase family protein n=1 Tax=Flavobacterium sp. TaxID=239 RepID=UPI00260E226A|nr:archaeosortase/exosortase family protein [Flavobacterium sp.]MDD5149111.1 archaeosortase/exosortase family protein [Flavobacterium sp.]